MYWNKFGFTPKPIGNIKSKKQASVVTISKIEMIEKEKHACIHEHPIQSA